jgi:hypothetical protein
VRAAFRRLTGTHLQLSRRPSARVALLRTRRSDLRAPERPATLPARSLQVSGTRDGGGEPVAGARLRCDGG